MRRLIAGLLLLAATATAARDWQQELAVRDSLISKGPLLGHRWLEATGRRDYLLSQCSRPDSGSGLRCIGRWSYGPSLKVGLQVTGEDTIVCLTRGSGATLARFSSASPSRFDVLGELDFDGIPRRAVLVDTLVVAGIHTGRAGIEVHGVSDPAAPHLLARVDLPMVNDICINESLVYVAGEDDTLRIYSIADPRNPVLLGACRDSCDLSMSYAAGYCYLVHVSGVNIVDVRNPAAPHRVGRIAAGVPLAVHVRDTICFVVVHDNGLRIYGVGDPAAPRPLGSILRPDAWDLTTAATNDTLLVTSYLDVINVANPASPLLVGTVGIPAEHEYGVAVLPAQDFALVANYVDGIVVTDIRNPSTPIFDTAALAGGSAVDIAVDGDRAYVASTFTGMTILDALDPTRPTKLGGIDWVGDTPSCNSVAARDSFAYMHWYTVPLFKTIDVSDPSRPAPAGSVDAWNPPRDMVLRDSFVYLAEGVRFEVINAARPRQPVLVGSCVLPFDSYDMDLQDTLAFVGNVLSLQIINVASPGSPNVVGTSAIRALGVAVADTIAYLTSTDAAVYSLNVARPTAPVVLDTLPLSNWATDVVIAGDRAYASGDDISIIDISDPSNLRLLQTIPAVAWTRRLGFFPPYLYAACSDGGVCIYETLPVGINESRLATTRPRPLRLYPNPARDFVALELGSARGPLDWKLCDVAGRVRRRGTLQPGERCPKLTLDGLPGGVYVVDIGAKGSTRQKLTFVKRP